MKVLIVAATDFEFAPLKTHLSATWTVKEDKIFMHNGCEVELFTTGIGMVATTFSLTQKLANNSVDLVLQIGVAGSFDRTINLTEIVFVTDEQFGDLGAQDGYNFLDLFDLGLLNQEEACYHNKKLINPNHNSPELRKVSGITVNMVSGEDFTVASRYKKYQAQVETMEGAAFHYVCLQWHVPFLQIRSISNYVERRNRDAWKMKEAITTLNEYIIGWINNISA